MIWHYIKLLHHAAKCYVAGMGSRLKWFTWARDDDMLDYKISCFPATVLDPMIYIMLSSAYVFYNFAHHLPPQDPCTFPLTETRHVKVQGNRQKQPTGSAAGQDTTSVGVSTSVGKIGDSCGESERQDVLASNDHDQRGTGMMCHAFDAAASRDGSAELSGGKICKISLTM